MKYDPSGKNSSGAPSNTASTVTPASRANRANSPNRRLRAPGLSLCHPTRCAITLLPSTKYDIAHHARSLPLPQLPQQPLRLIQRHPVTIRRPVTPRPLPRYLCMLLRRLSLTFIQREPRQKIMNLRLRQTILTTVGNGERLLRVLLRFLHIPTRAMPVPPRKQNVWFYFYEIDAAATRKCVVKVCSGGLQIFSLSY